MSNLREKTISAMRELVEKAGVTRNDGYKNFAFDESPSLEAYAYKGEVRLADGVWIMDYSKLVEGSVLYLGESKDVDHALSMTPDDIFGEEKSECQLSKTLEWFKKAKPNPTTRDLATQIGCHIEEMAEFLESLGIENWHLKCALASLIDLSNSFKSGALDLELGLLSRDEKIGLLDANRDIAVTGVGVDYMLGCDVIGAHNEVNESNWSKFENGKPIFDENGKIKKGKDYRKPELDKFLGE